MRAAMRAAATVPAPAVRAATAAATAREGAALGCRASSAPVISGKDGPWDRLGGVGCGDRPSGSCSVTLAEGGSSVDASAPMVLATAETASETTMNDPHLPVAAAVCDLQGMSAMEKRRQPLCPVPNGCGGRLCVREARQGSATALGSPQARGCSLPALLLG